MGEFGGLIRGFKYGPRQETGDVAHWRPRYQRKSRDATAEISWAPRYAAFLQGVARTVLKHAALFAGMGGFIEASRRENYTTLWANEIEPKCWDVLRANYPDTEINTKSISELDDGDVAHLPSIDLLTAGFPCQSFSQREGL